MRHIREINPGTAPEARFEEIRDAAFGRIMDLVDVLEDEGDWILMAVDLLVRGESGHKTAEKFSQVMNLIGPETFGELPKLIFGIGKRLRA